MYEAVVTFVTKDTGMFENDEVTPLVITKVFRLEFESERNFNKWLHNAANYRLALASEQLKAGPGKE